AARSSAWRGVITPRLVNSSRTACSTRPRRGEDGSAPKGCPGRSGLAVGVGMLLTYTCRSVECRNTLLSYAALPAPAEGAVHARTHEAPRSGGRPGGRHRDPHPRV